MARATSKKPAGDPVTNASGTSTNASLEREFLELCNATLISRQELIKGYLDPRRDIAEECGYPAEGEDVGIEEYLTMFACESIATRVVEVIPKEVWQVQPSVFEDPDSDNATPFEQAWDALGDNLRGKSWRRQEEGSPIWRYLKRADIESRKGRYGVLLLGFDDAKTVEDMRKLVPGIDENGLPTAKRPKGRRLNYLRPLDESSAKISSLNNDRGSRRFGQPQTYKIKVAGENNPEATEDIEVHWSRVLHIAEALGSSEVLATPAMQPVWRRLLDLSKLYGGSAEMYWRGAFPGLSIETHPNLGGDVTINAMKLKAQMLDYSNRLQRYLALVGASAKSLAPQVVDPTAQIDVQITAICIQLAIPKRIFMGSERGELASSQDDNTWEDRKKERRDMYVTPGIIEPFVDRMICVGCLPEPPKGYVTYWPEAPTMKPVERAQVLSHRVDAMVKYVSQGGIDLMEPMDFLTREMEYSEEDAISILKNVIQFLLKSKAIAEDEEDDVVPGRSPLPDPVDKQLDADKEARELDDTQAASGNGKA